MWIHVTALGLVQSLVGAALFVLHFLAFGSIVWLHGGMTREQRTARVWIEHAVFFCGILAIDALFAWWLRDRLMALAGVLLVIVNLIVLLAVKTLLEDERRYRTARRWAVRIVGVCCIAALDAAYVGWLPFLP